MNLWITGATSGIMKNVIKKLQKQGHFLYLTTHTQKECDKLRKEQTDDSVKILKFDVTSSRDRKKIPYSKIDCLILNAAVGRGGSFIDVDIKDIQKSYDINLFANLILAKEYIKEKKKQQQKAKIILISSLITQITIPYFGIYASSKASALILFQTLAKEVKDIPWIQIKIVLPGAYATGFNQTMITTAIDPIDKNSLSYRKKEDLNKNLHCLFQIMEKKKKTSIEKQILKAISDSSKRVYYIAPLSSLFFLKGYQLFHFTSF